MSRNKLIQQYAPLLTSDMPQRIYDMVKDYIEKEGVGNISNRQINGFYSGELSFSMPTHFPIVDNFTFYIDLISLCRIDKHGDVFVDMDKINKAVDWWKDRIYNLHENDYYSIKGEDENYVQSPKLINLYVFSEIDDLLGIKVYVPAINDTQTFNIQVLADYVESMRKYDQNEDEEDDEREIGEFYWDNPEYDTIDNYYELQEAVDDKYSGWMAFLYNLRSGSFGDLPDDYDGLAWIN